MNIPPCLLAPAVERIKPPPDEAPCLACALGNHPDVDHDGCGCPCGWTPGQRRSALVVTCRPDRRSP